MSNSAQISSRAVETWLWMVAFLVLAMVVVGGATRLTGSGLSITEWKPILGAIPPMNDADWFAAFDKYKQIPQYKIVNEGMTLSEFKGIFWWEWSHRFLGRMIGFAFALPLFYFWWRGRLRHGNAPKLVALLGLGALQGGIGWFMVYSGLADRVSVSQYRLALHLSVALMIVALLVWLALEERTARLSPPREHVSGKVRRLAPWLVAGVAIQVVLGAFVAGLKAGLIYNTWPEMDGQWVPADYWLPGRGIMSVFESHAAAQFNHRLVAYVVLALVLWQLFRVLSNGASGRVRRSLFALSLAVLLQVMLGILTLVLHVPLHLALTHQAMAVAVLSLAVWHLFETRRAGTSSA